MASDTDNDLPERPSKSERKREMLRLQALGERLADLGPEPLERVPVSAELQAALAELGRIKAREGRRRQLQYIGRLMRGEDTDAIAQALARLEAGSTAEKRRLHQLEQWRERLLSEGDGALGTFLDQHPAADRQHLRQLIRGAQTERDQQRPPAAARKLFRYLREITAAD